MTWKTAVLSRLAAALLVLVTGSLAALACTEGDWALWQAARTQARWDHSVITGVQVLVAMVTAHGLAAMIKPLLRGPLPLISFWLGKALAFFPVTCLAWGFLGWWIGQLGHPIWTLMPATDTAVMPGDAAGWGRWLWTWVPGVALLVVPLTGQCLSLSLEREKWARDLGLSMLGFLALGLMIPIEDILGVEGAGSTLARVLRQSGDGLMKAQAVWTITGTATYLAVCLYLPRRLWPHRPENPLGWVRAMMSAGLKLAAWFILGRFLILCLSGRYRDAVGSMELFDALDQPQALLNLGLAAMLWPLSFWALGHIIRPRFKSSPLS